MTTAELMQKRYKVTGPYPFSQYDIGDILYQFNNKEWFGVPDVETGTLERPIHINVIEKCPNIFKEIFWWEDRKESDLPKYVKTDGAIFKVNHYRVEEGDWYAIFPCGSVYNGAALKAQVLPATQKEFEEYESQK